MCPLCSLFQIEWYLWKHQKWKEFNIYYRRVYFKLFIIKSTLWRRIQNYTPNKRIYAKRWKLRKTWDRQLYSWKFKWHFCYVTCETSSHVHNLLHCHAWMPCERYFATVNRRICDARNLIGFNSAALSLWSTGKTEAAWWLIDVAIDSVLSIFARIFCMKVYKADIEEWY